MRKSANKDRVHVSLGLVSEEGGRVGCRWNVMHSFWDCC